MLIVGPSPADEVKVTATASPMQPVGATVAPDGPRLGVATRWTKRQKESAAAVTPDAPCTPVFLRAAVVGPARMPRAALEITGVDGTSIGNVALPNTSAAFDPHQRFWLVGPPEHGAVVALVSEGGTQVILAGSRLRADALNEPEWSPLACRLLGWQARDATPDDLPAAAAAVLQGEDAAIDNPRFTRAVRQFRTAAVTVPIVFFAVCFPYLFVIRPLADGGANPLLLLALPVLGGGLMTMWAARCRRAVGAEADRIEAGAARWGKEIAFTQSYWASMRRPAAAWSGPLPKATR